MKGIYTIGSTIKAAGIVLFDGGCIQNPQNRHSGLKRKQENNKTTMRSKLKEALRLFVLKNPG